MARRLTVIAAAATPFTDTGDMDIAAARRLYHLLTDVTDGVLVAGTTGEFPALDDGERLTLLEAALDVLGPDRVIAHVGAADARHTRKLASEAVAVGARRLAAITPYYLPATVDEITAHYTHVADGCGAAELYAYLYPERTGLTVTAGQLAQVAAASGLAGAKLSGSAGTAVADYVAAANADFRIFTGSDEAVPAAAAAGAAGVISGMSTAYPEVFWSLADALADGDQQRTDAAQRAIDRIVATGRDIGHLKYALAARGVTGTAARMAVGTVDADGAAAVAALVGELASSAPGMPAGVTSH